MLRVIAISGLLVGLVPGVARGAPWLRPVSGRIVGAFSFSPADPYAAGQRRGIVLSAAPGAEVRAACAGRVTFAGSVGNAGPTVSVQCGSLRATYQGLQIIGIEEGQTVRAGETIAHAGASGAVHLGARAGPNRYVDPAALFADPAPPLGPAPRARPFRHRPVPPPTPAARDHRPAHSPTPSTPPLAWLGLAAALAAAGPVGLLAGRRRTRRGPARRPALSPSRK